MITRITSLNKPIQLDSIYSIKLNSIYEAYGLDNDFCKFYSGENFIMSALDNEYIIADYGRINNNELVSFFLVNGYKSIFLNPTIGKKINKQLKDNYVHGCLMEYYSDVFLEDAGLVKNGRLDDIFAIISNNFPNINYESWYVDISHRIRHGVSNVYLYNGVSTVTAICKNQAVLLTLLATSKEYQHSDNASTILQLVASRFQKEGKRVFIICEDTLMGFYNRNGFYYMHRVAILNK